MYNSDVAGGPVRALKGRKAMSKQYEQDKQKYEREIEEILAKYDREAERRKPPEPPPHGRFGNFSSPGRRPSYKGAAAWRSLGSGQYMLLAFVVGFLALFVQSFSHPLANFLVIVSAVLFLVPILLYWSRGWAGGSGPQHQKRWRRQVIDFNTHRDITDDPFASIKRWFRRR